MRPSSWHRIAPTSWHALVFGLATGAIVALAGICIWLAQAAAVTITGVVPAQLTVTDGPVHITMIQPATTPSVGIDA
jgi:hypothetical protein